MMEVLIAYYVVFGRPRTTDYDRLNVFEMRQPIGACMLRGPLEEIMSSFLNQSLETLS